MCVCNIYIYIYIYIILTSSFLCYYVPCGDHMLSYLLTNYYIKTTN